VDDKPTERVVEFGFWRHERGDTFDPATSRVSSHTQGDQRGVCSWATRESQVDEVIEVARAALAAA
jgi:threonine aldolase